MMFDKKSRYAKLKPYEVTDHRGRKVMVVPIPASLGEATLGVHLLKQGQKIDHLAYRYLDDAAGFWHICEGNDAMLPESLTEARELKIPKKKS